MAGDHRLPVLSGFWSKDKIIETAFATGDGWRPWVFGLVALLGAGITAFYMSRLYFMTFLGKRRWVDDAHPHESPALMTVPLVVLALGSLFLGGLLLVHGGFQTWLEPSTSAGREGEPVLSATLLPFLTVLVVAAGVALAWRMYLAAPVPVVAPRGSIATVAARRDLFQDDVNEAVFMRPGQYLTRSLVFGDVRGSTGPCVASRR